MQDGEVDDQWDGGHRYYRADCGQTDRQGQVSLCQMGYQIGCWSARTGGQYHYANGQGTGESKKVDQGKNQVAEEVPAVPPDPERWL